MAPVRSLHHIVVREEGSTCQPNCPYLSWRDRSFTGQAGSEWLWRVTGTDESPPSCVRAWARLLLALDPHCSKPPQNRLRGRSHIFVSNGCRMTEPSSRNRSHWLSAYCAPPSVRGWRGSRGERNRQGRPGREHDSSEQTSRDHAPPISDGLVEYGIRRSGRRARQTASCEPRGPTPKTMAKNHEAAHRPGSWT
jgi:hypothetical protein